MRKRTCDRCSKEIDKNTTFYKIVKVEKVDKERVKDLCIACFEEIFKK